MIPTKVETPRLNVEAVTLPRADLPTEEHFHSLLRGLPWPPTGNQGESIVSVGFTSCLRHEGVTRCVVQTAVAAASCDQGRVLVVDANLHAPSLDRLVNIDRAPGFTDVLLEECELREAVSSVYQNLDVMSAGRVDRDPASIYGAGRRLHDVFSKLEEEYSLLLVDLPPIGTSNVTWPLLQTLDGIVLVVEAERVDWTMGTRVRDRMRQAGVNLLGAVVNHRRRPGPKWCR